MATRRGRAAPPDEDEPVLRESLGDAQRKLDERLELGQQLLDRPVNQVPEIKQLRNDYYSWDEYNEQLLRRMFTSGLVADRHYRSMTIGGGGMATPAEELVEARRDIEFKQRRLASIRQQLELYEAPTSAPAPAIAATASSQGEDVFLVHGRDGETKLLVAGYIEKITGRRPVILHEQPNAGRTIIEKFEDHAGIAGFAVVLLTADDEGGPKAGTVEPRARQNVIFELGFFIGQLGRGRVVALLEDGVEKPSDIDGLLYVPLSGSWQFDLAKEMRAAHISVDLNKV